MNGGSQHPKCQPRFVLERQCMTAPRKALESGETVRERFHTGWAIYTPVRVKSRYWTTRTFNGSVIHIATGRGLLTQGDVATHGRIDVEPYCNGRVEWPRSLSSPQDFPERRLCPACLEKAHGVELVRPRQPEATGAVCLVIMVSGKAA